MKVLIADDDDALRFFLKEVIQDAGHEVCSAREGAEVLPLYDAEQPDLVLLDIWMPGKTGLEVLGDLRAAHPEGLVVMLTGEGSEELAIEALRARADNYLLKPLSREALVALLAKYGEIVKNRALIRQVRSLVHRRELTVELGNEVEMVAAASKFLISELGDLFPPEIAYGLDLGLYELIMNAVEHGNLGVTFQEKRQLMMEGPDRLLAVLRERADQEPFRGRRVQVEFRGNHARCEWIIQDEGEGFEWELLPDPLSDEGIHELNGRGIFLAKFHFDEVNFLGRGNRVRVAKYVRKPPTGRKSRA